MSLQEFLQGLPADLNLCPIERKGVGNSTGKKPIYKYRDQNLNGHQVVDLMEKDRTISAAGVWCGTKNQGLVILDVDHKLHLLKRDKSKPLGNPPVITSTREDAAKFVYRVPREKISSVSGLVVEKGGSWSGEIIWANQGVIAGAYPGNADGSPVGEYKLTGGSFDDIPEAPAWLLAKMENAKPKDGWISKGRTMRLTDRAPEVSAQMIFECLDAIPPLGSGSYEQWIRIGMAVHSELPTDLGLALWVQFSEKDADYENAEAACEEKWKTFKSDGKLSFGTLSRIADIYDPEKLRMSSESKEVYDQLKLAAGLPIGEVSFEDMYSKMDSIYKDASLSAGRKRFELLRLGAAVGIRSNPVAELKEIYMSHMESLHGGVRKERTAEERWENPETASYYVPGLLCAGVWLVSGKGGSGKTNACWSIAKHFLSGAPLEGDDGNLEWEKGNVLWLTGDQPDAVIDDQMRTHLTKKECAGLQIHNNFDIEDYPTFQQYAKAHKPKLVVIDSLRSTSRNHQVKENDSEFALPLRWYEQMMGDNGLFPQCMIIVLHHSGHGREGARGTSSLNDMTSFAANFQEAKDTDNCNPATTRIMTLTKHRFGLAGRRLFCSLQGDGTVKLVYKAEAPGVVPATVQERIRLHFMHKPANGFTVNELVENKLLNCTRENTKKAIQRMIRQGTAEVKGMDGKEKLYGAKGVVSGWVSGDSPSRSISVSPIPSTSTGTTEEIAGTEGVPGTQLSPMTQNDWGS